MKWKDKTCHKSQKNVQNVSELKKIKFRKLRFEKYYYVKRHFLLFSCSFEKQDLMFRISQCVSFRKKNNTTCQILNQTLENVSEVEKNLHSKGRFMNHFTPRKRHLFAFSLLFQNAWIKKKFFYASMFCIGIWKKVCFPKITLSFTLVNKTSYLTFFVSF